jgi:predicted ATP-grasp superfamily ATP-dependent carboligase
MKILVTDGDNRASLAVVRSLGRQGHWIAVAERHANALAHASRFCTHRVSYPDPFEQDSAFVETLARQVRELNIDVIMPISDVSIMLISEHRAMFEPTCRVPISGITALRKAADKVGVLKAAMRLGVLVPRTVFVAGREIPRDFALPFPVVVKPARSRTRTADGWIASTVSYARDRQELIERLAARHEAEFPVALQEYIEGPGIGAFFCYDRGTVTGLFCHRRLREKPPSGGVSVLSESIPLSDEVRRNGELLLNDIGWQGVAMVEFKQDVRDGLPRLMEINGRFWGSLQLAIDAGVDFPALLLKTLETAPPRPPGPYKTGVRNRWFWGDVDALLIQVFSRTDRRGRALDYSRLRAVMDFMRFFGRNLRYENPRLGDLGPFLHETRTWLRGSAS